MKKAMLPLNLSLLVPTKTELQRLRPVTTLDIFDGPGGNFHDDGLFSTITFGRVGDPERDLRFGYINLKVPILHPVVYTRLVRLKALYKGIIAGTVRAAWNPETKDFESTTDLEGDTGYAFFMRHLHELSPAKTGSSVRDLRVTFFEKYRNDSTLEQLLVLPAGLRDADIDADGRVSMDEVNDLYQSVLMISRNMPERVNYKDDMRPYDRTRLSLTLKIVEIYEHFERLISGKKGFIQARFASRRIFNGTRNVLSSLDTSAVDLSARNRPGFNDTVVGIYQASKSVLPKSIYALKTSVVGDIFDTTTNQVQLVEPQTYKSSWVDVSNEDMDRWTTDEGLEKVINELSVTEKRSRPVMVAGHFLALVYVDDKANYRIVRSIDELPEGADTSWLRPITLVELIYLAGRDMWYKNAAFVTRYPVENYNSSYPTKHYVKTTVVGEMRYELDENLERKGEDHVALEYPRLGGDDTPKYHDSTSVSPARLAPLGGDFNLTVN